MENDVNKEHSNMDTTEFVDAIDNLYKNNNLHKGFIVRFLLWIIPKVEKISKKSQKKDESKWMA